MDSKRIYCLQFVIQEIRKNPEADVGEVLRIGLKFGEQLIYIHNQRINFIDNVIKLKKGKICFFEEGTLGFEIFAEFEDTSRASAHISFISFQDKESKSILNADLDLKNSSKKKILSITVIGSRHLLDNLGRTKESFSIGTQTSIIPKKNDFSQTESQNSYIQPRLEKMENSLTEKEHQNSNFHMKPEKKTISTQTIWNPEDGRKQLFKLVLFLVYRISLKLNSVKNQEEVVPEEPRVNLKDARQFSELRKRQIEEMRERLRIMAEARREILEQTEKKLNVKPDKKLSSMDISMDKSPNKPIKLMSMSMDEPQPSNLTFSIEDPKFISEFPKAPEIIPESIFIPEVISPSKASSRSKGSSVPSPLESDVFDDFEELQEVDSGIANERRKSYTLNQEKEKSVKVEFGMTLDPSSAFLNPNFNFSNKPKPVEKKEESPAESISTESDTSSNPSSSKSSSSLISSEESTSGSSSGADTDSSSSEPSSIFVFRICGNFKGKRKKEASIFFFVDFGGRICGHDRVHPRRASFSCVFLHSRGLLRLRSS
ncbi:hypothetical protein FO519_006147 [Halicephalobus sp. NKZ332]|nr:hypothetical protein FO519_006147 [Halicephalobus sp. NKZ332]